MFTLDRLRSFAPNSKPELRQAFVAGMADIVKAGITTPIRARHFMAQIATETGGLSAIEENLNYSAERLHQVWPTRFPTVSSAQPYAHNPQALANRVYRNRLGNGGTSSNDGWNFRGGGMLQTTGRDNYRRAGHEADPAALRTPLPALLAALKFWSDHGCNALADQDAMMGLRKVINGGTNGLEDCRTWLSKAKGIFV